MIIITMMTIIAVKIIRTSQNNFEKLSGSLRIQLRKHPRISFAEKVSGQLQSLERHSSSVNAHKLDNYYKYY